MAILHIPATGETLRDQTRVTSYLKERGIWFELWEADVAFASNASEEEILGAYQSSLKPFMAKGGYAVADVINVHQRTPNLHALRANFLREHTHVEDEIRFFVDGEILFWFNTGEYVFSVKCSRGELLGIPAHMKHWSDLGERPFIKAIRIFKDKSGWVPYYTESGVDEQYNPQYHVAD